MRSSVCLLFAVCVIILCIIQKLTASVPCALTISRDCVGLIVGRAEHWGPQTPAALLAPLIHGDRHYGQVLAHDITGLARRAGVEPSLVNWAVEVTARSTAIHGPG